MIFFISNISSSYLQGRFGFEVCIVIELEFWTEKNIFHLYSIAVLLSSITLQLPSCQIFEIYILKSRLEIVVTEQYNVILDNGIRASLDSNCHHQINHISEYLPRHRLRENCGIIKVNTAAIQRSRLIFHGSSILILTLILTGKLKLLLRFS